jgi:hypothetical protein
VVKEFYYAMKGGSPQIKPEGGNANVNFWGGGFSSVREWPQRTTYTEL